MEGGLNIGGTFPRRLRYRDERPHAAKKPSSRMPNWKIDTHLPSWIRAIGTLFCHHDNVKPRRIDNRV